MSCKLNLASVGGAKTSKIGSWESLATEVF